MEVTPRLRIDGVTIKLNMREGPRLERALREASSSPSSRKSLTDMRFITNLIRELESVR